ncbi:amidohydrolase family protein [Chloroflexota bacterium]
MEVIDFHTHLVPAKELNPHMTEFFKDANPEFLTRVEDFEDPRISVELFKSQGVKYAIVLAEEAPATSYNVSNEEILEYCRSQDMLIPFASVNPNSYAEPVERLTVYVKEYGARGLKLLPSYQFYYLNEPRLYPLYARAQELKIPVLIHVGSSMFKGTRLRYCDPIYLDDIAVDFPDLTIVMAHSGRGFWYEQCFFLSRFHKNIYMELSGLPPKNLLNYFPELDRNGEKVIFGSDWPAIPCGIKDNVETIKSLPLSDKTIEGILYKNAERILFG